jgi:hypothetical protein
MISSPGCLCRINGASSLISTRFWMTSRPGALRSCRCRSIRVIPGTWACCAVPGFPNPVFRNRPASGEPVRSSRAKIPDPGACEGVLTSVGRLICSRAQDRGSPTDVRRRTVFGFGGETADGRKPFHDP